MDKSSKGAILRCAVLLVACAVAAGCLKNADARGSRNEDRWTAEELAVLASLRLSELPPDSRDPSNAFEDHPAAIALGKQLFFDTRFSRNQAISCGTCHDPAKQFQDNRPLGQGLGITARRTMPVVGAGHGFWLFWDGRKDSLWSQALGPLEDAKEHGGNRLKYAHLVTEHYRNEYEAIFGPLPDLSRLPSDASPRGTPAEKAAWDALDTASQRAVSQIFANMGKAIAAFQKTLQFDPSRLDRYIEGVLTGDKEALQALTASEKQGLRIFIGKADCVSCHNGPLLTDQSFHNTGVPPRDAARPDPGRAEAGTLVSQDEFNCLGPFSDAKPQSCQELRFMVMDDPTLEGAFKTPTLRNVSLRPPYMHAGQVVSLADVVRHYIKAPRAAVGHNERKPMRLSEEEAQALVDFLGTLSGPIMERAPQS